MGMTQTIGLPIAKTCRTFQEKRIGLNGMSRPRTNECLLFVYEPPAHDVAYNARNQPYPVSWMAFDDVGQMVKSVVLNRNGVRCMGPIHYVVEVPGDAVARKVDNRYTTISVAERSIRLSIEE